MQWAGPYTATWQPAENLNSKALKSYTPDLTEASLVEAAVVLFYNAQRKLKSSSLKSVQFVFSHDIVE